MALNKYYENSVSKDIDLGENGKLSINALSGKPHYNVFLTSIKNKTNNFPLTLNFNPNAIGYLISDNGTINFDEVINDTII